MKSSSYSRKFCSFTALRYRSRKFAVFFRDCSRRRCCTVRPFFRASSFSMRLTQNAGFFTWWRPRARPSASSSSLEFRSDSESSSSSLYSSSS